MVRNLTPDERQTLDDALTSRPEVVDEDGNKPPAWWKGEEDAANSSKSFFAMMGGVPI